MARVLENCADFLGGVSGKVNSLLFKVSILFLGLMVLPTVIDVLSRLIINRSLPGASELVEFCMVLLAFSGFGYIQETRSHISVTMITNLMKQSWQRALELVSVVCPLVLIVLMTVCLWENGMSKYEGGDVSGMLYIPIAPFLWYASLASAMFSLALLAHLFRMLADMLARREYGSLLAGLALSLFILSLAVILKDTELAGNFMLLGSLGMLALIITILLGMPIGLAMSLIGFIGMLILYPNIESSLSILGVTPYVQVANYTFSVIPMFILMGELAMISGISEDLFTAANIWLGRLPGGLAIATVTGCAGFAAVAGDSMATAMTMASVALPEMRKKNYDAGLACATLAAGGTLGILIPPSTGFIFYALVTEVSIGKLFVAGIIPGLMLTLVFTGIVIFLAVHRPEMAPRGEATTFREKIIAVRGVFAMLALILLVLGGILWGWFSPSEGGAIGVAGTFLFSACRGRLSWNKLVTALTSTAVVTSRIMIVIIGVGILGTFMAATALPYDLADWVVSLNASRYVILLAVVIFFLVMGCVMNVMPMILLTLPAIYPTIVSLGFDPVWFGVVTVILMEAGQITPPVGINVFALSSVATDIPMARIFRRIIPFFIGMMLMVLLLTLFPSIATWLPSVLF